MCGAPHPVVMESYDKAAAAKLKAAASSGAQDEEAMVAAPSPQGVSVRTLLTRTLAERAAKSAVQDPVPDEDADNHPHRTHPHVNESSHEEAVHIQ